LNHGIASKVLGGWEVGGVHRYQSGSPVVISESATSNPYSNGNFRLSVIPGVPLISPNASSFNASAAAKGLPNSNSGCKPNNDGTFTALSTNNFFNCAALIDPNAAGLLAQRGYTFGNLPTTLSKIRTQGYVNEDFSIIKRTMITETHALTFKADIPNAFNRHVFGQLDGGPTDSTFGVAGGGGRSVLNGPRQIQLTLRYEF
jgi:hypothetical protein